MKIFLISKSYKRDKEAFIIPEGWTENQMFCEYYRNQGYCLNDPDEKILNYKYSYNIQIVELKEYKRTKIRL